MQRGELDSRCLQMLLLPSSLSPGTGCPAVCLTLDQTQESLSSTTHMQGEAGRQKLMGYVPVALSN